MIFSGSLSPKIFHPLKLQLMMADEAHRLTTELIVIFMLMPFAVSISLLHLTTDTKIFRIIFRIFPTFDLMMVHGFVAMET
jgi:hypothetical protein